MESIIITSVRGFQQSLLIRGQLKGQSDSRRKSLPHHKIFKYRRFFRSSRKIIHDWKLGNKSVAVVIPESKIQREPVANLPGIISKYSKRVHNAACIKNISLVHIPRIAVVIIVPALSYVTFWISRIAPVILDSDFKVVISPKKIFGKIGKFGMSLMP